MAWVIGKSLGELSWARMMPAIRRRSAARRDDGDDMPELPDMPKRDLNELIEGEIIPRLMMVHSSAKRCDISAGDAVISPDEAERFAAMPLTEETSTMMHEIETYLARGVCVESIFLDLLAPSARKLGKCWEEDQCDFVDVTVGLARLHEVLREVALRSPSVMGSVVGQRNALFSPAPDDQHSFGAQMLEEIFNRSGWYAESLVTPTKTELLDRVAMEPLDLVGLTLSNDCSSGSLKSLITAMRGVSANPQVCILVGGRMVNADPSIVDAIGADGTAMDGRAALALADQFVMDARLLMAPAS